MSISWSQLAWIAVLIVGACLGIVAAPDLVWNGADLLALALVALATIALRRVTR